MKALKEEYSRTVLVEKKPFKIQVSIGNTYCYYVTNCTSWEDLEKHHLLGRAHHFSQFYKITQRNYEGHIIAKYNCERIKK